METDPTQADDTKAEGDESVEEFREELENDPSTAHAGEDDDTDIGRLRGG